MQCVCVFCPTGYPVSVSGMITLPVSSSVYQSMVANIQQIHTNSDGTLCITPMQVHKPGSFNANTNVAMHQNHSHTTSIAPTATSTTASGHGQLNNNTNNTSNANLLQLCRALNNTMHYNHNHNMPNGHHNINNNIDFDFNDIQIKTEKDCKYTTGSPAKHPI